MVQLSHRMELPTPARRLPAGRLLIGAVLLVGIEAIVIARWWTGTGYVPPPFGISDAGEFTAVALPIARFLQEMAGVAVVGLLFARCWLLTTPRGPAQARLASGSQGAAGGGLQAVANGLRRRPPVVPPSPGTWSLPTGSVARLRFSRSRLVRRPRSPSFTFTTTAPIGSK